MNKHQRMLYDWRMDPVRFVRDVFKAEPDAWQVEALRRLKPSGVNTICLQACVGPGKSCELTWAAWWWLTVMAKAGEHPKGAAVAITADNLRDNLWSELRKWQERSDMLKGLFTWQKERIFCNQAPETWFLSARSYAKTANAEEMGRTLSGLHSKFPFILLDETGDMHPAVGRAASQAMSNCECGLIIQAGNPSSIDGLLYDSAVKNASSWDVIRITSDPDDPNRTPRVSKEWAEKQIIAGGGRDNPWVMYSILGQFPPAGFNALIGPDEVRAAMGRPPLSGQWEHAGLVIGVDVALEGDDSTIIFPRRGINANLMRPRQIRNGNGASISAAVSMINNELGQGLIAVDNCGGYGAGTYDTLTNMGYNMYSFKGSEAATDPRFYNLRSECYWKCAQWIREGGCLPDIPQLVEELCAHEITTKNDRLLLMPKDMVKKKIGRSPDWSDALSMTFAPNVAPILAGIDGSWGDARQVSNQRRKAYAKFNPLERI